MEKNSDDMFPDSVESGSLPAMTLNTAWHGNITMQYPVGSLPVKLLLFPHSPLRWLWTYNTIFAP